MAQVKATMAGTVFTVNVAVGEEVTAVNAVYSNHINAIEDPKEKLASELNIDEIESPSSLREVLADRFRLYSTKQLPQPPRKHPVNPV